MPNAIEPSGRLPRGEIIISFDFSHRFDSSCRQWKQMPHAGMNDAIT